jgi:hypothetical protein
MASIEDGGQRLEGNMPVVFCEASHRVEAVTREVEAIILALSVLATAGRRALGAEHRPGPSHRGGDFSRLGTGSS